MTPDYIERYARHLVLKEIGGPGQKALTDARVAIVGAGGLGGPAGLYLAAAGIGHLTLIDDDVVALSNLQRQIQFSDKDREAFKVTAMSGRLSGLNPHMTFTNVDKRLNAENSQDILAGHDVILDGTDSFETRFLVNAAALLLSTPLVSGALGRFDAQVSLFPSDHVGPCYQCLVPEAPLHAETCSEVGVVGALAGIAGSMMALETIKHLTGAGKTLSGRVWVYDGLAAESRTIRLSKDPDCLECGVR